MRYCEKHGVRMETPEDTCKFCASEPTLLAELAILRARVAAAIALCEEIERLPYAALSGMAALPLREAARAIRAKLEST